MVGRRFSALLPAVVLFLGVVGSQPASASHWCSPLTVSHSPGSGYAGDAVNVGITLTNGISDSLDVSQISVTFGWSTTTWDWGTMSLGPYASDTNTYSLQLPSTTGDYTVRITVTGQATGDWWASSCGPFSGTFRVNSLPPPPTVSAIANPTTGSAPLTVSFTVTVSDGLAPFTYQWTFGDGTTGSGSTVSHTYSSAGPYTAQVVVTDGRGRSASDSVAVTVSEPSFFGGGPAGSGGTFLLLAIMAVVVVVAAVAVAVALSRRKKQYPPPIPPTPPSQPPITPP